jgi:phosphoserine aminotransferase
MKKYNFNAGPSMLPREVIENTAKQILDFNGSGLSLMEISHRAKDFQPVVDEAAEFHAGNLAREQGCGDTFANR